MKHSREGSMEQQVNQIPIPRVRNPSVDRKSFQELERRVAKLEADLAEARKQKRSDKDKEG